MGQIWADFTIRVHWHSSSNYIWFLPSLLTTDHINMENFCMWVHHESIVVCFVMVSVIVQGCLDERFFIAGVRNPNCLPIHWKPLHVIVRNYRLMILFLRGLQYCATTEYPNSLFQQYMKITTKYSMMCKMHISTLS